MGMVQVMAKEQEEHPLSREDEANVKDGEPNALHKDLGDRAEAVQANGGW